MQVLISQHFIITVDNLLAAAQYFGVTFQLYQSDTGHDICHVAFEIRSDNIVLPCTELCFGQCILILAVKGQKLKLLVKPFVVDSRNRAPSQCSTFCCGEIFYRMERKRGKISNLSTHFTVPFCSKCMSRICKNNYSTNRVLQLVGWLEQLFFIVCNRENTIVITNDSCQIHRNDDFCPGRDSLRQLLIIHFERIRRCIDHD